MIDVPTVFILGAGASRPYGFPTAFELTKQIYENIEAGPYVEHFERLTGLSADLMKSMAKDLRNSGLPSIDLWLERRRDYLEVGRTCIAKAIIEREITGDISKAKNWYAELWSKYLLPHGNSSVEEIGSNKVGFITFNYDRSLEQALMLMITSTYGLKVEQAAQIINKIAIIHVYGQVGRLPWQPENVSPLTREYQSNSRWDESKNAAPGIKIIHEANSDTAEFEKARELLYVAERVYFLGFGYHDENMKRLKIVDPNKKFNAKGEFFRGSAFNLEDREREPLTEGRNPLGKGIRLGGTGDDVLAFIQKMVPRV